MPVQQRRRDEIRSKRIDFEDHSMDPTRLNLAARTRQWVNAHRSPSAVLGIAASGLVITVSMAAYGAQLGSQPSPTRPDARACSAPSGTWTATGSMKTARSSHTAALLRDGRVLVAGGEVGPGDSDTGAERTNSAEIYDPKSGTWARTGSMNRARAGHTALRLNDGRVLVLGGDGPQVTAELYDPSAGTWSSTAGLGGQRRGFAATLLHDGKVLLTGGGEQATAAVYDPTTKRWTRVADMGTPRRFHAATLLDGGRVLIVGGTNDAHAAGLATAEIYDPANDTWSLTGSMATSRETDAGLRHEQVLLPNRQVLVVGGGGATEPLDAAERYDESTGRWSSASSTHVPREQGHTLTPLSYGKILLVGGRGEDGSIAEAELYDSATNTWSVLARPASPRLAHSATSLSDGRALIAGGRNGNLEVLAAAELLPSTAQGCPQTQVSGKARTQSGGQATTHGEGKRSGQAGGKATTPGEESSAQTGSQATTKGGGKGAAQGGDAATVGGEKPITQVDEVPTGGVETGGSDTPRWDPGLPINRADDHRPQQTRP
jgi:N-acetylneuraminic acid mutarotase